MTLKDYGLLAVARAVVVVPLALLVAGCGSGGEHSSTKVARPRAALVDPTSTRHCLDRHGFSTRSVPITPSLLQNIRPRPSAWVMFLGRNGGGILLFYSSDSLARQGAARWDAEEQARVCRLLGKAPTCSEGFPRYETKRTRQNVFLNFNLGVSSNRTVDIVEQCVAPSIPPARD